MKNVSYWGTTGLFGLAFTMSGLMTVTHQAQLVAAYQHLGYPEYFMTLLGAAKLAGVATLVAPGLPRLKEWAYAGFAINLAGAVFSHLSRGDNAQQTLTPAVFFVLLLASWYLRPNDRKLASPESSRTPSGALAYAS